MGDLGVRQGAEQVHVEAFVAQATVEGLDEGVAPPLPGGMNSIPILVPAHSVSAAAIISGPLSNRSTAGPPPRVAVIRFSSVGSTSPVMERSTSPPRHSRVCSSIADRILTGRPSVVESPATDKRSSLISGARHTQEGRRILPLAYSMPPLCLLNNDRRYSLIIGSLPNNGTHAIFRQSGCPF
jgi:hypothetical protein